MVQFHFAQSATFATRTPGVICEDLLALFGLFALLYQVLGP
jgi:hypothetical protein